MSDRTSRSGHSRTPPINMSRRELAPQADSAHDPHKRPVSELTRLRTALVGPGAPPHAFLTRIPIRTDDGLFLVPTSSVVAIVAKGVRLTVTTVDHAQHSLLYRLRDLEARLDPSDFLRVSRGVIVNINAVSRIVSEASGTSRVVLKSGEEMRMSRNQTGRLRRVLLDALG